MAAPSRPANAASLLPTDARNIFRTNSYYGTTSGFCRGYLQAGFAAIPADLADDFAELCRRNRGPLPLLYRSRSSGLDAPPLAEDSDIRRDIPRYRVYSQGQVVDDILDLDGFSWENVVTFYIGCSSTAEESLLSAGIAVNDVPMYRSNIQLYRVGRFSCSMVVTMRPVKQHLLARLVSIMSQFPDAHGIPAHIGNPARIGIASLSEDAIAGDFTAVKEDEVPVFLGCALTVVEAIAAAKPQLAFTHYPGSMFITDIQYQPRPQCDQPKIVPLAREGDPFFASIIAENKAALFLRLEKIILDDPGKRGVARLFQDGDLLKAVLALSHANKVAVTTGFPCLTDYEVKEETDGLPGALALCQGLLALGKQVTLVSDRRCKALYSSCVDHAVSSGCLPSPVPVLSCDEARALQAQSTTTNPAFDCLVAIERAGRASDGTYRTMKAVDISNFVDPIDDLFSGAHSNPLVSTVGIGDGGNELGMGKALAAVREFVDLGEQIACVIPTDFLIAAGVSNWAGYAISVGLYIASSCPLHWRYCKHGIDAESPPAMAVEQVLPNAEQTASLLRHMNGLGIRDGISHGLDQSVDGLPLQVHLDKLDQIRAVTLDM